jgi:hypothetical protein
VGEKPNVAWDRQDLERLYARLQNQYALNEQAEALSRKLSVVAETAEVLTDGLDPRLDFRLGEVPKQPTAAQPQCREYAFCIPRQRLTRLEA